MTLPDHLAALRDEALLTSCDSWAKGQGWTLAPGLDRAGPCPACGGTDRFSIHTRKNLYSCRQCGIAGEGVIKLVMDIQGVGFIDACELITGHKADAPRDPAREAEIRRQNEAAEAQRAAEAERYRQKAREDGWRIYSDARTNRGRESLKAYMRLRGIDVEAMRGLDIKLWEHPNLPLVEYIGGAWQTLHTGPAQVAAVQRPDGTFGASHSTWIDLDQPKGKVDLGLHPEKNKPIPAKKVRGTKQGGAIRLFTPETPRRIVMGEGVETTLTALSHNFEPGTAYWAGVDLGNMAGKAARDGSGRQQHGLPDLTDWDCFLPPDWCEELVYLAEGDSDEKHSLEKVTRGLLRAQAWRERRLQENPTLPLLLCTFVEPVGEGKDLNDLVRVML